jgi:hypothetical protein
MRTLSSMTALDHLQAAVLKDLSKMAIAGVAIIILVVLLLWGLGSSAEAAEHFSTCLFVTDSPKYL